MGSQGATTRGSGARPRLESLTALRFAAALAVVAVHSAYIVGPNAFGVGRAGVSFFFILSGFVLTWTWRPATSNLSFYWRRFLRIYPLYAVTTMAAIALVHYGEHLPVTAAQIIRNMTLTQAWSPNPRVYYEINNVAWSLSAEAFFYLVFPFAVRYLAARSAQTRLKLAVVLAYTAVLWCGCMAGGLPVWATYILPFARLPEFLLGMLAAFAVREGWTPHRSWVLATAAAGIAVTHYHPVLLTGAGVVPFTLLIARCAAADAGGTPRPLVRLGEWSYALYLIHALIYRLALVITPTWPASVVIPMCVAVSIAASAAAYLTIERPVLTLGRPRRGRQAVSELAAQVI